MRIGSTEWKIAEAERKLVEIEEDFKALQEERAKRPFEISEDEETEILNILNFLSKKYKEIENEIEKLKKTA